MADLLTSVLGRLTLELLALALKWIRNLCSIS